MRGEKIVHFVCFETPLDAEAFIDKWEHFTRSDGDRGEVTIQQSEKNGVFKYVVQHHCAPGGFRFVIEKARRSSRNKEIELRIEMAGGYQLTSPQKKAPDKSRKIKLFIFLANAPSEIETYASMDIPHDLNIYQPYYENCRYAYILEYLVEKKNATELMQQLQVKTGEEAAIYKSCLMQLS